MKVMSAEGVNVNRPLIVGKNQKDVRRLRQTGRRESDAEDAAGQGEEDGIAKHQGHRESVSVLLTVKVPEQLLIELQRHAEGSGLDLDDVVHDALLAWAAASSPSRLEDFLREMELLNGDAQKSPSYRHSPKRR